MESNRKYPRVLITGANGQLGKQLTRDLQSLNFVIQATDRSTLNLLDRKSINVFFAKNQFEWIVNAAAFTQLDLAEYSKRDECRIVNAEAVAHLVDIAKDSGAKFIQISTDAVFGSEQPRYFTEHDEPSPWNYYGETKAKAEQYVREKIADTSWIIRSSWSFGEWGGNFLNRILEKIKNDEHIKVVNDQFGQPTWTKYIAEGIKLILFGGVKPGIYHCAPPEFVSRARFAEMIGQSVVSWRSKVIETPTVSNSLIARRPTYSLLETSRIFLSKTNLGKTSLKDDISEVVRLRFNDAAQ